MNKKEFGLNLAKIREKVGISAYELSLRLGRDSTYINKIENGLRYPSVPMLFEIADALKIDVTELFIEKKMSINYLYF